ncbi:hypothetical protein FQA39_LY16494 [Lamprigera yunnana]|nr:hypothetical protein FQA39_LY16494 [Lamprigera yunnana]
MKNFKAMWDVIGRQLSNLLSTEISPKNWENLWKVLNRNYKKWVDNKNSTGCSRKLFEFSKEMDDTYGKKRNVNPILTLGNKISVPVGQMREDLLQYQENRLSFLERAHKEAMMLLREENEIERERNEILKQKNCPCKPK